MLNWFNDGAKLLYDHARDNRIMMHFSIVIRFGKEETTT